MERKIERVLILAGKPVMTRPIAAAIVLDALPAARQRDRALCEEVERYLRTYMRSWGITSAKPEIAATSGDSTIPIPNRHGLPVNSSWEVSASGYARLGDYVIVNVGGVAYEDEATATGSFVSLGFDFAQLDIGFRDHWLSPLVDSSSLISTEAPTMPSVTLSNYKPLTPLGISYEIFGAKMSRQEGIRFLDTTTSGSPRLAGLHLALEPVTGYAVAINRTHQYGGGARSSGNEWSDFWDKLLSNSNAPAVDGVAQAEETNKIASLTSAILFPGKVPLAVRAEYAGEDNAYAGNRLLGATNFSLGLDFPQLWRDFDLTYEVSEWQNDWYVHNVYPEGMTHRGLVIGHWFGDQRQFGDAIGGWSQMLRAGWRSRFGYWQATYRTSKNEADWRRTPRPDISYQRMQMLGVSLSTTFRGMPVRAELDAGEDVFGDSFARLAASIEFADVGARGSSASYEDRAAADTGVDLFFDVGVTQSQVTKILGSDIPNFALAWEQNAHVAVGVRRPVSERSDLGARLEWDRVDGAQLLSFRAVDYRYRLGPRFALTGFFGVGRYDVDLPAYGYYYGAGLQYRNILNKWDLSLDLRQHYKLGRDKTLLPNDPPSTPDRTRMFFDIDSIGLYLSRRL